MIRKRLFPMAAAVCALALFIISTDAFAQAEKKKKPPKKAVSPVRDPAGQPFRLAPMSVAPRTVAIPLAKDYHVAFDTELLRTHTAWNGPSLNLYGSPYRAAKVPFYCDFDGTTLWTNPALFPWAVGREPKGVSNKMPEGARYRGLSSKGRRVTLIYELTAKDGQIVTVHETPRRELAGGAVTIVRRFEISPSASDLWFLAHAEFGSQIKRSSSGSVGFGREKEPHLAMMARGLEGLSWNARTEAVSFSATIWKENKNDTSRETVEQQGDLAQAWLKIPAHKKMIAVEVVSYVYGARQQGALIVRPFEKPNMERVTSAVKSSPSDPAPKVVAAAAEEKAARPGGNEFYKVEHFRIPGEIALQVNGLDVLPNGDLAVCTWLGEIWIIENPTGDPAKVTYRRFARGLCEPCGLKVIKGEIYVVQKVELTRVVDTDGNGEADLFDCINQGWGATGNYHDFSFGPLLDDEGNFYVYRTGNRGIYEVPYMGWALKISPDGSQVEGVCSGFRSPNGFGTYQGDLFMADNQGNWLGTCTLNHVKKGRFYGFPSTSPAPLAQFKEPKQRDDPAIWFPYKLSASTSDMKEITDDRFGSFKGQLVVGDWKNANIMRVQLEKVNGEWQGCVWPMAKGFWSGVNRFAFAADGNLYVGGCKNRAWAALGPYESSLDRVSWTGKMPFEVKEVHAKPDGFELTFTQPVNAELAGDPEAYDVLQYNYRYHETYGSKEYDHAGKENSATTIEVTKAMVSKDRLKVRLTLKGWKAGYVTTIRPYDVENDDGDTLWNDTFFYTLNSIPKK
ncbi:MAG: DUF6797 domain-containing protein [Verrucomicrobiia bacterium]|jgi:glucose/arabinose dehydrogenase